MTFDELIRLRPSSHVDGLLPTRYLSPEEVVLYQTRPSFVGFALPGIAFSVAFPLVVTLAIWLGAFGDFDPLAVLALVVLVSLAGAIGTIIEWLYRCYAVTTSRILDKRGAWTRTIVDIPTGAVQSVVFTETAMGRAFEFGSLVFSSAAFAGFGGRGVDSRPGVIQWRSAPFPLETRAFYETVRRAEFE